MAAVYLNLLEVKEMLHVGNATYPVRTRYVFAAAGPYDSYFTGCLCVISVVAERQLQERQVGRGGSAWCRPRRAPLSGAV